LTSLFLSLKSTNHPFSLASYARKVSGKNPTQEAIKEVSEKILALEFKVSMALDFEFWVLDPTRGVGGVLKGLEVSLSSRGTDRPFPPSLENALENVQESSTHIECGAETLSSLEASAFHLPSDTSLFLPFSHPLNLFSIPFRHSLRLLKLLSYPLSYL